MESQIINVPIEDIIPNRFQPRLNFDETSLQELASSIKEHGIIQPLVLRRLQDKYEIIAGERRYKASKMAGLTSVPAIITKMDDRESAEVAIVENIQRKDLSAIEEAKSYKNLLDKGYLDREELSKKMGLSKSAIANKLRLLSLPEIVQNALMEGKISERHARSLLQIEDAEAQEKWLNRIIEERLTVRDLDKKIKEEKALQEANNIEEKEELEELIDMPEIIKEENMNTYNNMPNKFFNFLEDEEANMETKEPEEEIELLDFLAPTSENPKVTINHPKEEILIPEVKKIKDMQQANNIIDKMQAELKNNDYQTFLAKNETEEEIIYTITINKTE